MPTTMVYDIETIPDIASGRRILGLDNSTDEEVYEAMLLRRREQTQGSDFLPHYLHQIIVISVVVSTPKWVKVWSLGEKDHEPELLTRFFQGIQEFSPVLVSWNGGGFDLPVLHYRALLHGIAAPRYWESGDTDNGFKWNNYLSRYHQRHTDVMDVLAGYQTRAFAPLDEIAVMLGFPGKMGMKGSQVFEKYRAGELNTIRNYCETDVLNTYLVYLRFQFIRGIIDQEAYDFEQERLKNYLLHSGKPHLLEFEKGWQNEFKRTQY